MRPHSLAGVVLTVFLGIQAAYPQAAAESVLLNSNSATATVKAGSALGKALNKASSNLGNQVPRTVAPSGMSVTIERKPRTPAPSAATPAPPTSSSKPAAASGSLITSIQGGHVTRSAPALSEPVTK
ncbi:MAG TPA: hypothetical protein VF786_10050 [Terriglobales bacterium]